MKKLSLGIVDYVAFVGLFMVSMAIGIYFGVSGRKKESAEEYLMGGRKLSLVPVCLSIVVSIMSTNSLLGNPAEVYNYGIMITLTCVSHVLASCIVAMVIVPLFHPLKLISVNEYLELRFRSRAVRLLGCFIFLLHSMLYVGTVIFGPAIVLNTATGAPEWLSILLVALIGTAYTSIGGMKAVVWTDVFQSVVMMAGFVAVIILGTLRVGSFKEVWRINEEWGRTYVHTESGVTKRWTLVSIFIGLTNYFVASFGVNQPCVQRFCALPSVKKSRIAVLLNGPGVALLTILAVASGFVAFAFYTQRGCDPISSGTLTNQNQIMPYFVMEVLSYPGLPGVFISSLFSASLSTLSSSINSMAAVTWEDILKPHFEKCTPHQQATANKAMVVIYGLICMFVSYMVLAVGGNVLQISMSFFGTTIGPIFGLFILGALVPWANWKGALVGCLSGLSLVIWMMFGQVFLKLQRVTLPAPIDQCNIDSNSTTLSFTTENIPSTIATTLPVEENEALSGLHLFYSISFTWFSLIGVAVVVVVGVIVSAITGFDDPRETNPEYFFPFLRGYFKKDTTTDALSEKEMMLEGLEKALPLEKGNLQI